MAQVTENILCIGCLLAVGGKLYDKGIVFYGKKERRKKDTKKRSNCSCSAFRPVRGCGWYAQGDSNPCRRRERAVSWTRLDDERIYVKSGKPEFFRSLWRSALPENALIIMNIAGQVKTKKRRMFFLHPKDNTDAGTAGLSTIIATANR